MPRHLVQRALNHDQRFPSAATERNTSSPSSRSRMMLAGLVVVCSSVFGLVMPATAANSVAAAPRGVHVLTGSIADVLVRVGGGACSGTPIAGTRYVVTAAHCVIDRNGDLEVRTVVRGEGMYTEQAVLVDRRYHEHPTTAFDAAVLVMDRVIAGPSARIGSMLPTEGSLTLAGYQAIDRDGTLLRGRTPYDRPLPSGATGTFIQIASAPAGCTDAVASLEVSADVLEVQCGLIPGASGGGLFVDGGAIPTLVGIVSTVSADVSANGVVPVSALHELLDHPGRYYHALSDPSARAPSTHTRIIVS